MSHTPCKVESLTKSELLHKMSQKTGFTLRNCNIAYNALVEIFADTIEEGRAIVFQKFGRIEPYVKPPRKLYKLVQNKGLEKDAAGRPVSYIFPAVNMVKFHMSNFFKWRLNPGIYSNEEIYTDDTD